MEQKKGNLKHYKNDSLGNSKFVATVKYFLAYVYHLALQVIENQISLFRFVISTPTLIGVFRCQPP